MRKERIRLERGELQSRSCLAWGIVQHGSSCESRFANKDRRSSSVITKEERHKRREELIRDSQLKAPIRSRLSCRIAMTSIDTTYYRHQPTTKRNGLLSLMGKNPPDSSSSLLLSQMMNSLKNSAIRIGSLFRESHVDKLNITFDLISQTHWLHLTSSRNCGWGHGG